MKLRTIGLISILVLGLLAAPLPTEAQQPGKVYRIGYVSRARSRGGASYDAFRQRLRELGYVEGQNLVIERRSRSPKAGTLQARTSKLVAGLVRLKVDVIVIGGSAGYIRAAKGVTRTIPIVMRGILVDPVEAGFVMSLAKPGGNITGLTSVWLEILKEAFLQIARVAIIWTPRQQKQVMTELEAAGPA